MCGLTAIYGKIQSEEKLKFFRLLAMLSSARGEDSSGIFDYIPKDTDLPRLAIEKVLQSPYHVFAPGGLFDKKMVWERYVRAHPKKTKKLIYSLPRFIGAHARFKTVGKISIENAHPFQHGDITGMHNGTIHPDFSHRKDFETDSEAIFYNMNTKGERETLDELLSLTGSVAFALIWVNTKEQTANVVRNQERPLFYQKDYQGDVVYFSSDQNYLKSVCSFKSHTGPSFLTPFKWLKFPLDKIDLFPVEIDVEPRKFFRGHSDWGYGRGWIRGEPNENKTGLEEKESSFFHLVKRLGASEFYSIGNDVSVSRAELNKRLSEGCDGCAEARTAADDVYFFPDKRQFLCGTCFCNKEIRDIARKTYNAIKTVENPDSTENDDNLFRNYVNQ